MMKLDTKDFRNALGNFATGVCIITSEPEGEAPFGMTVNSFASVSLEPPLILWSLQNNSECFDPFQKSETFCVNILSEGQEEISNRYAKKGDHVLDDEHFVRGVSGLPIMQNAVTSFECKVWARYPGGDHMIMLGEVLSMQSRVNGRPLLFHQGTYGVS